MKNLIALSFFLAISIVSHGQMHTFKPLPYAYDALEPYIDAKTVEIHYDRHHRAYFNNFIKAAEGTEMATMSTEQIFGRVSQFSEVVRNNAGGWYNHDLYWEIMTPGGKKFPEGKLQDAINNTFGSVENLKKEMNEAGMKRFGSGWAWLIVSADGKLLITSTPNQDNPLMDVAPVRGIPIIGIDVWEHAYYLKYQNKRKDYLDAFWKLLNWDVVEKLYLQAAAK